MKSMATLSFCAAGLAGAVSTVSAFTLPAARHDPIHQRTGTSTHTPTITTSTTTLFLEDHIADLIDGELVRIGKLKEWEVEWQQKNKQYMDPVTPDATETLLSAADEPTKVNTMQLKRDQRLAEKDPQQYCADRCVATGNCDVYEDMFDMSPMQVMEFCNECVLAEDEEAECPIPDTMYGEDDTSDLRTGGLRP